MINKMNGEEIKPVPKVSELKKQSNHLGHADGTPSLAEQAIEAAARANEKANNVEEDDYTYPSGKVRWEDTEEGWYQTEIQNITGGYVSDKYDAEKVKEFNEKFRPFEPSAHLFFYARDTETKKAEQEIDEEKDRPPRPSDRVEVRTAIWNEKKKEEEGQHCEIINITQSLLGGRILDRMNNAIESEKQAVNQLENHIDATLELDDKKTVQ